MITLKVNGREMEFSEEELENILQEYFSNIIEKQVSTNIDSKEFEKVVEVNPVIIISKRKLFEKRKNDVAQEKARRLILEAIYIAEKDPQKYQKVFQTIVPKKKWNIKTVEQLKLIAISQGGHMANWIEQALEWAQRIIDGETWIQLCNRPDTSMYYRVIEWKNGYIRVIGGAIGCYDNSPAFEIGKVDYDEEHAYKNSVPLIVRYKN